ncbi:OstA-like protein [Pedobacter sp.]|uniref:OstA-like protein n=1 Tax=Pedobacter sp. TaxID=1411316 RepID=UPI002CCB8BEB|nr:OstA-like protein [Pedobacter sp.]HWW43259.1 OstA-like protein [Pedobacter sp.]
MRKLLFFILLIALLPVSLLAQQRTKIFLDRSEHATVMNKTKISYLRKPVFRQDNAILTCDSAVFYEEKNVFEAYNNVHINQADTVNIYSDFLTYDGNTKMAHLTSNVRLLDRESVLTTNILDYNMATKVGTYVTGGKIVNKDVTLTSKNGYYFAGSRDAYFRYNVVAVTPQTTIKSDTLRYNTLTNWTYFYGPTNILGKDDNLYTENGAYNTKTQYAYFGKKNLYTSGSRSLKGDSLYYDGAAGYGKAVRNIVFRDTTDKTVMYGQLGYYYKIDQRTLVTKNAYVGLGTSDSITVKNIKRPDSLWMGADTLETQVVLRQLLKLLPLPIIKKDNEVGEEKPKNKAPTEKGAAGLPSTARPAQSVSVQKKSPPKKGGIKLYKSTEQTIEQVEKLSGLLVFKSTASLKKAVLKKDSVHTDGKKPGLPKIVASGQKTAIKTLALKDTIKINPLDTVKARIIKAYHKVRVFKTNMQAKADSLFYTSADSTLRWYYHPILWSDGSQQTGDTLYVHMRNKKINAVQVLQNAFTVNVYKDSTKFNQIKGRLMTGFFKDGKLNTMYVDGNAESAYFTKTDKGDYDKMNRTISSRIKIIFKENEIYEIVPIKDVEGTTTPVAEVKEEVLLTGFIWKPELRPLSKADIIRPIVRKPKAPDPKKTTIKDKVVSEVAKQAGKVPDGVKKEVKETVKKALSDSTLKVPAVIPPQQVKPDSTAKPAPLKKQ